LWQHEGVPPRRTSRHTFAVAVRDTGGALVLHGTEPYRYRELPDTRVHEVKAGDTLFSLAARYFEGMPRPAGMWWVIVDFQPVPIHDPTIALELGRLLYIPSLRVVKEEIFSSRRRLSS